MTTAIERASVRMLALVGAVAMVAGLALGSAFITVLVAVPLALALVALGRARAGAEARHAGAVRRQEALSGALAALARAPDPATCEQIVVTAALDAIGHPAGVSARVVGAGGGGASRLELDPPGAAGELGTATIEMLSRALSIAPAIAAREERHVERVCRSLVRAASDLVFVVDRHGAITFHSPSVSRDLGYPVEQLAGCSIAELVHPDDRDVVNGLLTMAAADGERHGPVEWRMRRAQGGWLHVETTATGLLDDPRSAASRWPRATSRAGARSSRR